MTNILLIYTGGTIGMVKDAYRCPGEPDYLDTDPELKGLVLETYGAGNAPMEPWLVESLKKAMARGVHIINVTQCSGGSVQMGQYETSEQLKKLQVISGKDITTEAAITKLMYLLGNNISGRLFKTVFETPLRGEMQ